MPDPIRLSRHSLAPAVLNAAIQALAVSAELSDVAAHPYCQATHVRTTTLPRNSQGRRTVATKPAPPEIDISFLCENLETPHSQRVESSFLVDLRRHPRYDTDLPAEVVAESGERVSATVTNISLSGMRLEGSGQAIGSLFSKRNSLEQPTSTLLHVSFALPDDSGHLVAVQVQSRVVYTRRDSDDVYQAGMEFIAFDEGEGALEEYLLYRRLTG
jgi:hypothetical protein